MKKTVLVVMLGVLLVGVNAFAGGDLIVDGRVLIGTTQADPATGHQVLSIVGTPFRRPTGGISAISGSAQTTDDTQVGYGGIWFHERSPLTPTTITKPTIGLEGITMVEKYATVTGVMAGVKGAAHNYNYGGTVSNMRGVWGRIDTESVNGDTNITNAYSIFANAGFYKFGGSVNIGSYYGFYGEDISTITGATNITNAYGMCLQKQTKAANNYGIVLAGDGAGSDIVFSPAQNVSIYSSTGELFVKDGAGNVTLISPHDPQTGDRYSIERM